MFTFVTSCCSPHISTSQQKSSTECLKWCQSGCVRILPFDRLRGFCHSTVSPVVVVFSIQGMYKGSEPIRLEHVLWMVRSRSEICPKFPKFPKFPNLVRSSSIVFIEILLIFDNLSYFGVFLKKKKLRNFGKIFCL